MQKISCICICFFVQIFMKISSKCRTYKLGMVYTIFGSFCSFLSHAFLKKRRGYCNHVCPSVCLLCYLLLNHWTKFNQILCVSYSHELGVIKRSYIIKFQLQSQFQRFLYQTVCVFSQVTDRKHIEQNFYYIAGFMPQGWHLGVLGGGSKTLAWGFVMAPHGLRILL